MVISTPTQEAVQSYLSELDSVPTLNRARLIIQAANRETGSLARSAIDRGNSVSFDQHEIVRSRRACRALHEKMPLASLIAAATEAAFECVNAADAIFELASKKSVTTRMIGERTCRMVIETTARQVMSACSPLLFAAEKLAQVETLYAKALAFPEAAHECLWHSTLKTMADKHGKRWTLKRLTSRVPLTAAIGNWHKFAAENWTAVNAIFSDAIEGRCDTVALVRDIGIVNTIALGLVLQTPDPHHDSATARDARAYQLGLEKKGLKEIAKVLQQENPAWRRISSESGVQKAQDRHADSNSLPRLRRLKLPVQLSSNADNYTPTDSC